MAEEQRQNGSVLLLVVFAVALLSVLVIGILQINAEEIKLMQNQVYAAKALAVAEAGLNDAFASIRADSSWTTGFTNKAFNGDSYTVAVTGTLPNRTITSTGTTTQGFVSRVAANVTVSPVAPHTIRIDNLRINE